jgi:diguanylate cyclase (GGDEF)-like protein
VKLAQNLTFRSVLLGVSCGRLTAPTSPAQEFQVKHCTPAYTSDDRVNGKPQRTLRTAAETGRFEDEGWRVRKDGSRFWASVVIDAIRDDAEALIGFAKITRDVTDRRRNEERLYRLAHFDALTGLLNRRALRATLDNALRSNASLALLLLDLDEFKAVNDTLGHAAGDGVLVEAATRIKKSIGEKAIVGRLGGDEFAVLLPRVASPEHAEKRCHAILEAFGVPFSCAREQQHIGLTIGIAICPQHGSTSGELLANADLALYRAKAEGRNGFKLYEPSLRQVALAQRACEQDLHQAVASDEFELLYQPQVHLNDGEVVGAEALLRWRHPQLGLLAPGAFIHVLERSSLAATVGEWALRAACEQAAAVRRLGVTGSTVAVNLFGAQFRTGALVDTVKKALSETALAPDGLELEVTETTILKHDEKMIAPLRELRQFGVGVSFDDFGTGYGSLSMLKRYPLSRLKIDQSFVRNICVDAKDGAVIEAVLHLGDSFGLDVIAEGIETDAQAERLVELGCQYGQGFRYGKPMTGAAIIGTFRSSTRAEHSAKPIAVRAS